MRLFRISTFSSLASGCGAGCRLFRWLSARYCSESRLTTSGQPAKKPAARPQTKTLNSLNASQAYETFKNGVPCGEYVEQQKGGSYVSKGEYIASEKLAYLKKEFATDTITVSLWQAGGDIESDPWYLSVTVLRNNAFFEDRNEPSLNFTKKLIDAVVRDTKSFHYNHIVITFVSAVYNATRYCNKEYKIKNGRVTEEAPAYEEWQLKNGVMQKVI